jgi:hypothetical protein
MLANLFSFQRCEATSGRGRSVRVAVAGIVALLAVSACGDGSGSTPEDTTTTAPSAPEADGAADDTPPVWMEVAIEGVAPQPRRSAALVAGTDGTLWLHGGRVDGEVVGDLWNFDGTRWEQVDVTGPAPEPRDEHVGVWDSERDRLVVALGQTTAHDAFDDVWAFDPVTGEWQLLAEGGPGARYGSCAVLDDQGRMVVSHGFSLSTRYADTWAFDLEQETWTDITPAEDNSPVARCLHTCGWDEEAGELVLFGGRTDAEQFVDDTWRLGADGWEQVAGAGPSARVLAGGVHTDDGFALLGGEGPDGLTDDAWRLAGDDWGPGPEGGPTARHSHAITMGDSTIWVFGGAAADGDLADLWRYA